MNQERENALLLKELRDQKKALDTAAIVAATDPRGVISYVNDKFCEISGYNRDELLGGTHKIVNSGYHDKNFFNQMWKTISSGQVWRGEIKNKNKQGHFYWVATTIVPFKNPEGQIYQYLSIRQDITELKKAQDMIHEQQAQLVASSKLSALGELSAALTHEINNPLGVILGRAEMLLEQLNDPVTVNLDSIKSMVQSIESTGRRIEKIMQTVKSLAHKSESEPLQQLTVKVLLDSVLDILGARLRRHDVGFEISLQDENVPLICRPTEIFQILSNLLSNAIDAVSGRDERWVRFEVTEKEGLIHFCFIDSGPGVTPDVENKLFTPFFTTKRIGVGTGLGLTISQSLAYRNKGKIYFKGNSPTQFCLSIPYDPRQV